MGKSNSPAIEVTGLTPLKRAFLALEDAQARLASIEDAKREPIAVIGLGCRVPGGGNDPASFWRLMHEGVDAIGPIPADRWDAEALYDPNPETPGRIATRYGGFLPAVDEFDPGFFNISPREAMGMDPQQRLLLEVAWEALEHAGQAPERLERSPTGVFIGVCGSDYTYLQLKTQDPALLDAHFTSGMAHSVVSGRLSYVLGLQGPSVTIDTACSSSLVAVHLAYNALRSGDCRMALAGGVNLILSPELFIALSHSRMLAPDGRCKTFDAAADGFARGEGCGVVVLKRLSDAQADGDRILALIRASAINQDGPSSGLTAPNGPAQEAVIREALKRAGLSPREVGFVEAHGTGTQLGDPLEVNALGTIFGADRAPGRPLIIGSVKTNLGHLEAASGVTGLIKVVLALQHRTIPPHLHFKTPSPHIAWADLPLQVSTKEVVWEPIGGRRIGGVSSFGFSGTNAHVVLEEAPPSEAEETAPSHGPCLLALSARDDKALAELARRFSKALEGRFDDELADICHTANVGRSHFAHRSAIISRTTAELRSKLTALSRGEDTKGVRTGRVPRRDPPRIAFLFTGQGAQYTSMSKGLYEVSPVFRVALDRCAEVLTPHLERPLLEVLFPGSNQAALLDETAYTQPALFAIEYAITELWRSWGVTPNAVMGHSVGEYVAACVAGVLKLEDALRLIAKRGRLMQSLPPGGAMAAIFAPECEVRRAVAPHAARLSIAAVNGPAQTVISGGAAEVEAISQRFVTQGIRCQSLPVSHAFHSPLVDPILDQFEREANAVCFSAPRIRLISNLTGQVADASEVTRPGYWRRHVREAVRFGDGLHSLQTLRPELVVEIGPHPTLLAFAKLAFGESAPPLLVPSLRKGRPDWEQMLEGLAAIYVSGAPVDWRGVSGGAVRRIVDLPTYPFQRQRYWFHSNSEAAPSGPALSRPTGHPLLGSRLHCASSEVIYEKRVSSHAPGFIRQHRVLDRVALPATAYLDMLVASAHEVLHADVVRVEDVIIREAMLFEDNAASTVVQTVCGPARDGVVPVSINSLPEGATDTDSWVQHVTANLRIGECPFPADSPLERLHARCTEAVSPEEFYAGFARRGIDFGDDFRVIRQLWRGEAEAFGEVALAAESAVDAAMYHMHPLLLDGCLQVTAAALPAEEDEVPFRLAGIGRLTLYRQPGSCCWSHVTVESAADATYRADVRVFDAEGGMVAELCNVQFERATPNILERLGERWIDECLYESRWQPAPLGDAQANAQVARSAPHDWLLFADEGGVAAGLAARLQAKGDGCILVRPGRFTYEREVSIDPTSVTDYRRLLTELHLAGRCVRGVVHAWSLDIASWNGMSSADLVEAQNRGAVSAMLLAQALVSEDPVPRLWVVTRGSQQADPLDRTLSPAQAPVWGLGNTLAIEHPELHCVCVDLDPGTDVAELDALAAELMEVGKEARVALRSGGRRVARLARLQHRPAVGDNRQFAASRHVAPASPCTPAAIRRDGTYLVTGGLSGLGLIVARWLAQRGAGRLVLIGRRGVTSDVAASLDTFRADGTAIVAESVDVSDEVALGKLLALIRKDGPPLRGVVHSAAVLDDGVLIQQDANRFARVFAPKVRGGWLLDRLTRCDPLDWFVMFSSIAAVLGSPGQSNYAAANAFLDLLARERRTRGLPGLSINWGAWTEVGIAADRGLIDRLAAQGLEAISPSQGLVALERLLEDRSTQAAVVPADWRRFVDHFGGASRHPFLAEVVGAAAPVPARAVVTQERSADLRAQLAGVPPARRKSIVAAFVRERALRVLGVGLASALDPQTPLGELGLDLLLAVELRNALGRALGVNLSATLLFDYPTVETLTNFLWNEVLDGADADEEDSHAEKGVRTGSTVLAGIVGLSDEEVERLFFAKQYEITKEH